MEFLEKSIHKVRENKFYLSFCLIGLFSGLVSIYYTNNAKFPCSVIATLVLALVVLFPLFHKIKRVNLDPFEPLTLASLGMLIYFIFPAIDLIFLGRLIDPSIGLSHYKTLSAQDDYFLATIISLCALGAISFYFGYISALGKIIGRSLPVPGHLYSKNSLLKIGLFYALLGIIIFGYTMWRVGGSAKWFTAPKGENIFLIAKCIYGTFLVKIFIPVTIILFIYALLRRSKFIFLLWIGVFVATVIFFNIFSQGSRRITLFLVFSLIVYYHYSVKPIRFRKIILIVTMLFFFNFIVGIIRGTIHLYNLEATKSQLVKIKDTYPGRWHNPIIKTMDFPYTYNTFMQIVQYVPTKVSYQWGSSYAKFFFWPIPRSWWPEKPESISRVAVRYFYPDMYEKGVSMSPTILGEAYFNFGVLGIVTIMVLFGIICQSFRTFLKKNRKNIGAVAVYASIAPYVFESFRGYFFECTMTYLFFGLSVFLAFYFARRKFKAIC